MQFDEMDTPEQHAAKVARLYEDERKRNNKRRLDIATVFLLAVGGAALVTETSSYLWMAFGGVMTLVGALRLPSL